MEIIKILQIIATILIILAITFFFFYEKEDYID